LTILVVDDASFDLKIAGKLLTKLGHRVDLAGSGADAVGAVAVLPYDLVFLDLLMPGMDGFATIGEIRAMPEPEGRVPVIALTSNVTAGIVERCHAAGFDGYLAKPLALDNLKGSLVHARSESDRSANPDALRQLVELLGMSAVEELVSEFLALLPQRLATADDAVADGDLGGLRTAVHQLAGTAAYLGLPEIVRAAGAVETACDKGDVDAAGLGVERLRDVAATAGRGLRDRFPGSVAPVPAAM
jgi:CheY-like chemotaxis protein